jgi:methionyl-tRNA synthetase
MSSEKKFYITTSIAYANAAPHMGHAYEAFLADVIARYKRMEGFDVFFLTGTDEHGVKISRAAERGGLGPQAFVDKNAKEFVDFYESLGVSYDEFIRTSDKEKHWSGANMLWNRLSDAGDIYKSKYIGLYCVGCESFVTEKDLVNGLCPNHNTPPDKIEEENYFFRLSKYAEQVKELIEKDEVRIIPESRKNEMLSLFKEGVPDVSFSRPQGTIPWGVPVPGDSTQVMYVWCDALANYISALGYGRENTENFFKYWPADTHVIGKDILRFHAIFWPAMLLSSGLLLPKEILVHGFITSEGKKMSKSIGNVVDPKEYIEKYGQNAIRAYFARDISPFEDGDFTEAKFLESYNANLANGLGNLVSRVVKMATDYFGGSIKNCAEIEVPLKRRFETVSGAEITDGSPLPFVVREEILPKYREYMDHYEIHQAAEVLWGLMKRMDGYVTDYEPYRLVKTDKDKTEAVLWNLLYGIHHIANMLYPIMPEASDKIREIVGAMLSGNGEPESFSVKPVDSPLFPRK